MCNLVEIDYEEGTISEEVAERCEGDPALYLDNFSDPFQHQILVPN